MNSKLTFIVHTVNFRNNFPVEVYVEEQVDENPNINRLHLDHGIYITYQEALDFAVKLAEVAIKGLADERGTTREIS